MVSQLINKKVLSTLAFSYTVISIGTNKSNKFQKNISRGNGVLCKTRHFVDTKIFKFNTMPLFFLFSPMAV